MNAQRKEELFADIRKQGIRRLVGQLIKSAVFYVISIISLFLLERYNDVFTRKTQPVVFWCVFAIIILIPILRYQFYNLFFNGSFFGEVTEIKNKRVLASKNTNKEIKMAMYGDISSVGTTDACVVTVRSRRGSYHQYEFSGNILPKFARDYYQVGDTVFHPLFAKYPYNETRKPSLPFCFYCGNIGDTPEEPCSKCGGKL